MKGDSIIVEAHHRDAAAGICEIFLPLVQADTKKRVLTIAGESGSGKSEIAVAVAEDLAQADLTSVIFQQDDYFIHPPKTNDRTRREDISWVGPQEVRIDLLDSHLKKFLDGEVSIEKPLVIYTDDRVSSEVLEIGDAWVAIAEGTYTTLLDHVDTHAFIDRDYMDTKKHRERRQRDESELDSFIDQVLSIEHEIIAAHKARAQIIVNKDYSVNALV